MGTISWWNLSVESFEMPCKLMERLVSKQSVNYIDRVGWGTKIA